MKGKLSETDFPYLSGSNKQPYEGAFLLLLLSLTQKNRPGNVIVFIVGGATYSEAAVVHELNAAPGPRVLLTAPLYLNSDTFVSELARLRRLEDGRT